MVIQKQDGIICFTAKRIILTQFVFTPIDEVHRLADIRLGYIQDKCLSIFELRLEFGKTLLPLESREIIPILIVEFLALGLGCNGSRLEFLATNAVGEIRHGVEEGLKVEGCEWDCDFHR